MAKMGRPPLIFILVLAVIAVLASRQFIRQRQETRANDAAPVRVIRAEVVNKRQLRSPDRRSRQREVIVAESMRYEVDFQPLNGPDMIRTRVKEGDFQQLTSGMKGELSMQGSRFIRFTPE